MHVDTARPRQLRSRTRQTNATAGLFIALPLVVLAVLLVAKVR